MKKTRLSSLAAAAFALTCWVSAADAGRFDACSAVVEHRPAPDVAYRPGVDVNGRPVVPADLNAPSIELPEELSFEIDVPMLPRDRRRSADRGYYGEALVGFLTLHRDGSLSFNGRPMDDRSVASLRAACAAALRRR